MMICEMSVCQGTKINGQLSPPTTIFDLLPMSDMRYTSSVGCSGLHVVDHVAPEYKGNYGTRRANRSTFK